MPSFAQLRTDYERAQTDNHAVDTHTTRQALNEAREALRNSAEARYAREHARPLPRARR